MDNAVAVRTTQPFCRLDHKVDSLWYSQRTLLQAILERTTFDVFHDDVGDAILLTKVVNLHDVGMRQLRNGAGLACEAFPKYRITRMVRG